MKFLKRRKVQEKKPKEYKILKMLSLYKITCFVTSIISLLTYIISQSLTDSEKSKYNMLEMNFDKLIPTSIIFIILWLIFYNISEVIKIKTTEKIKYEKEHAQRMKMQSIEEFREEVEAEENDEEEIVYGNSSDS